MFLFFFFSVLLVLLLLLLLVVVVADVVACSTPIGKSLPYLGNWLRRVNT